MPTSATFRCIFWPLKWMLIFWLLPFDIASLPKYHLPASVIHFPSSVICDRSPPLPGEKHSDRTYSILMGKYWLWGFVDIKIYNSWRSSWTSDLLNISVFLRMTNLHYLPQDSVLRRILFNSTIVLLSRIYTDLVWKWSFCNQENML